MEKEVIIREAKVNDIEKIMEIERVSFENPWSKPSFFRVMVDDVTKFFVADIDGKVVGYIVYWIIEDEAHVANIAVHPEMRGRGIGKKLLEKVLLDSGEKNVSCINLEVNEKNEVAKNFYFKYGFEIVGVRKRYYSGHDDALLLTKKIER